MTEHASPRRRHYDRPPIMERVLEVHVAAVAGDVEGRRAEFVQRWPAFAHVEVQTLGQLQFEWNPARPAPMPMPTMQHSAAKRLRFWRDDRKRLLQVGSDLFAANDLLPEPGWDELSPLFRKAYTDYREVMQPTSVKKGVLRYVNRVRAPKARKAGEIFKIFPALPTSESREHAPFQMIVDMGLERAGPSVISLSLMGVEGDQVVYSLEMVVESGARDVNDSAALFQWADEAHDRATHLFEGSITDTARALFKERDA